MCKEQFPFSIDQTVLFTTFDKTIDNSLVAIRCRSEKNIVRRSDEKKRKKKQIERADEENKREFLNSRTILSLM